MSDFRTETLSQGVALRRLVDEYSLGGAGTTVAGVQRPQRALLTGMGASFHVASWGAALLCRQGVPAVAVEASELMHFQRVLLDDADLVLFISQSGASAEVGPLLHESSVGTRLVAITNDPASRLARGARSVLPLCAGTERTVATMTYLNSMACVWLLANAWAGVRLEQTAGVLRRLADRIDALLADPEALIAPWQAALDARTNLTFLGHGPHAVTARQSAMMVSEVVKRTAVGSGIGDFRHGPIEAADDTTGVVLYGEGGLTDASVHALAGELRSYGCAVLSVVEGQPHEGGRTREFDEMLGAMLDVVPAQVYIASLARRLRVDTSFRHIAKVIERL